MGQIIFGAAQAKGRLPVSIQNEFPAGSGFNTKDVDRLAYGTPESVGMNSHKLQKIDSIINYTRLDKNIGMAKAANAAFCAMVPMLKGCLNLLRLFATSWDA